MKRICALASFLLLSCIQAPEMTPWVPPDTGAHDTVDAAADGLPDPGFDLDGALPPDGHDDLDAVAPDSHDADAHDADAHDAPDLADLPDSADLPDLPDGHDAACELAADPLPAPRAHRPDPGRLREARVER